MCDKIEFDFSYLDDFFGADDGETYSTGAINEIDGHGISRLVVIDKVEADEFQATKDTEAAERNAQLEAYWTAERAFYPEE